MSFKSPIIMGHRGVRAYAPENTAAGLHTAADIGADWVEIDVKLTKDQIPILFHDPSLERTTNGEGLVKDHTWDQLKDLDAGFWFSETFTGELILTLEKALEIIIDRNLGLNLEIKPCEGREVETTEVALDMVSSIWDEHDKLIISSYSMDALETSMDMAPDWARSLVLGYDCPEEWVGQLKEGEIPDNLDKVIKALQLKYTSIDNDFVSQEMIQAFEELGITPIPYNVNEAATAIEFQKAGLHMFISDEPDLLIDSLFSVH